MATVARGEPGPGYLQRALESIERLNAHPALSDYCLHLTVFNMQTRTGHPEFNQAQAKHRRHRYVSLSGAEFQKDQVLKADGWPCDNELGACMSNAQAGYGVTDDTRKRSLDFAAMLDFLLAPEQIRFEPRNTVAIADVVLVMEDDFIFCPNTAERVAYVLQWAFSHPTEWSGVRISHGFNGIFLQRQDLSVLQSYVVKQFNTAPIDDMLGKFWTGADGSYPLFFGKRRFMTYRYNLMEHIGAVTSLKSHDAEDQQLQPDQCMRQLDRRQFKQLQLYWDKRVDPLAKHSEFFDEKRACEPERLLSPCPE